MNNSTEIEAGYWSSLWKFFASIKLTVVVLLTLAVLSIIGTLIPQNQSPTDYFRAFGPVLYQILSNLDIFDMYHSWWFQLLMVSLLINIVVCSIDRLRFTAKIIFVKNPKFNLQGFRRRPSRREFFATPDAQHLKAAFQQLISKHFHYCRVVTAQKGYAITAEKGRWTRLGVYGVHLSVVILLLGAVVGAHFGFEGFVNIPEGETVSAIQVRNTGLSYALPFSIRCDDFDVQFYDTGAPKEFRSKLVILENGQPTLEKNIIVNDPLRYKGINIFQASYGKIDGPSPQAAIPEKLNLQFRSTESGMAYSFETGVGQTVTLPEGLGSFTVTEYQAAAEFRGMAIGPALVGTLTDAAGAVQTILLPLKFPQFDRMRQGKVAISVDKGVVPTQQRYYTGLQVTRDPGVGLVYFGFCLMIMGCMVTFFMSHQQVVVEVQPQESGSKVLLAGTTNKNKVGFQHQMQQMADKLEKLAAEAGG